MNVSWSWAVLLALPLTYACNAARQEVSPSSATAFTRPCRIAVAARVGDDPAIAKLQTDLMHAAIRAVSSRDKESVAWAYSRVATYELQRGRLAEATRMTEASLQFVEAGQLAVAACLLPLVYWLRSRPVWQARLVPLCSALIVVAGGYWFIGRLV